MKTFDGAWQVRPCFQVLLPSLATKRLRVALVCNAENQPKVKSSFYKRPSKAIEQGGGFYVPGLRGWRLRAAVGSLILALLGANHISAGKDPPTNFIISEAIASISAATVLMSAFYTSWAEAQEDKEPAATFDQATSPAIVEEENRATSKSSSGQSGLGFESEFKWASETLLDLTRATSMSLMIDNELKFRLGDVQGDDVGEVVRRVSEENKGIFIDDSQKLPPGVGFPFLGSERVSASVVPLQGGRGVLVVAGKLSGEIAVFDQKDRAWIQQVAERLDSTLGQDTL